MSDHFADRLLAAIRSKGSPVCVGLDPRADRLPDELKSDGLDGIETFCRGVLEAVAPFAPAVKPQSAYFEIYGGAGVELYFKLCRYARELGLLIIGDVKRNDIGSTAEAYVAGHLVGEDRPDAITVNGYLGADGLKPFIDTAGDLGRGLFVLVRTSNPSAGTLQDVADSDGKKLYVADIRARKTYAYTIQKDGSLTAKKLFCSLGSDGMTIDNEGNVYLTGRGVTVFNPKGEKIAQIPVKEGWTANVCFGGKDRRTLFITASKGLYGLRMRVKGVQ